MDWDRFWKEIRKVVTIPLVLHGARVLSKKRLRKVSKLSQVNFATETQDAIRMG